MAVKSGPWVKHITMTNVNGCRHIGEKTEKDWSICLGTFRGIKHFDWLRLCCQQYNAPLNAIEIPDKDELRLRRLERFAN